MTLPVALYSTTQSAEVAAFADGLRALGIPFRWRSHSDYRQGETEPFSAVVISGMRAQGRTIHDDYQGIGVPVIVIDYGYLDRVRGVATWATGHWQVGVGGLNSLPPFDVPSDRLAKLTPPPAAARGGAVLVCGQHVGDPSHGLDAAGIERWALDTLASLRSYTARPIIWRAHPDSPSIAPAGFDGVSTAPWSEALDGVHAVVTIGSNIGHEAILAGVPVFCSPSAPYAEIAHTDLAMIENPIVTGHQRSYFARLAYAQWTLDELRSGEGVRFVLAWATRGELATWTPPAEPEPLTVAAPTEPLPTGEPAPRNKPGPKPGSKRKP